MAQDNDTFRTDMENNFPPVEDKYETTNGGFCKLNIDLDPDVLDTLVDQWAEDELHPASLEMYHEHLEQNAGARATALLNAVINDRIIEALTRKINEAEKDAGES